MSSPSEDRQVTGTGENGPAASCVGAAHPQPAGSVHTDAMSETEVDPAKPPRFPYVAALLCTACVGAAVWTWMRYSYAWDATPSDFWTERNFESHPVPGLRWATDDPRTERPICQDESWIDAYVRVRGDRWAASAEDIIPDGETLFPDVRPYGCILLYDVEGRRIEVEAPDVRAAMWERFTGGERLVVQASGPATGRARLSARTQRGSREIYIDTTASRFTGASVAGLVVGAMGMFIFALALRDWLGGRGSIPVWGFRGFRGHRPGDSGDTDRNSALTAAPVIRMVPTCPGSQGSLSRGTRTTSSSAA